MAMWEVKQKNCKLDASQSYTVRLTASMHCSVSKNSFKGSLLLQQCQEEVHLMEWFSLVKA